MKLVAIILTLNEERHLARCIASLKGMASEIVVADCFSTDATLEIGRIPALAKAMITEASKTSE